MAAAQQQQQQQRSFEILWQQRLAKWATVEGLLVLCAGVLFALCGGAGALAACHQRSESDRITAWFLAAVSFLFAAARIGPVLYRRRKLKRVLAEMRAALDME